MKKKISAILCVLALCLAFGCGNDNNAGASGRMPNQSKSVTDVLKEGMAKEDEKNAKKDDT